jgi:hypothetical protein
MAIQRKSAQTESSSDYVNMKPGEYDARLVYVADLGLQERSYQGEEKTPAQQLALGIEIIGETTTVDDVVVPRLLWVKPFNIFYTMSDKGKEIVYYKVFNSTAQPDTVADWDGAIGAPCSVTIGNVTAKDGKVYDEIESLAAIPAKYQGNVGPSVFTDGCTGDAEDDSNPAQKAMYGLSRFVHARRVDENADPVDLKEAVAKAMAVEIDYSDIPF